MRSTTIETRSPRAEASFSMRSIWWLFPSTSATQRWLWSGVTPLRLVEDLLDHAGGILDDAGGHPLGLCLWCRWWSVAGLGGQDIRGCAGDRGEVVDGTDLGRAFSVALLALG